MTPTLMKTVFTGIFTLDNYAQTAQGNNQQENVVAVMTQDAVINCQRKGKTKTVAQKG